MHITGLPEGLELVRITSDQKLGDGEYPLSHVGEEVLTTVVRCKPGYTMAYLPASNRHLPIRQYETPKRLDLSFDGFSMAFEVTNQAQDEAVREAFEHLRHKLMTRVGLAEIVDGVPEGVYS